MHLGFLGTPDFAAVVLDTLLQSPHDVRLVFTQPDRAAGRGRKTRPSPMKTLAEAADVPVLTPTRLRDQTDRVRDLDLLVVAAYGLILPKVFLEAPRLGCVNVHASLLPRWRGAAPIEHALLAGDAETGVSIMRVVPALDAGPVYLSRATAIEPGDTGVSVTERIASMGAAALLEVLEDFERWRPVPQNDDEATYAPKLDADLARIDWRERAVAIERLVRALTGRQTAFATAGDIRLRVLSASVSATRTTPARAPGTLFSDAGEWRIATGDGELVPQIVQLNRGKGTALPFDSLVNGFRNVLVDGLQFDVAG